MSATDDPTAKLTFYAPKEYSATLTQPAGQTIGTVTAQGTAADLGGALLPLTGTVQVRAASGTYLSGTTQVPIAAAATQCTGTATHTTYWVLILQAAGQTLELPVFVDTVTTPPANAFASASIQACLPPPDVPVGTPGRATFGFKLTKVNFKVNSIFSSPGTQEARWRVLATPYNPGQGTPNAAGTVEAQSVVAFPRSVKIAPADAEAHEDRGDARHPRRRAHAGRCPGDAAALPRRGRRPRPPAPSRSRSPVRSSPAR